MIEYRTAPLCQVDPEKRIVEVIAVPWDEWTPVEYQGRVIEESFAPGSFKGVSTQIRSKPGRWLVNLEHDAARWVGRIDQLYPCDERGLRAELKLRGVGEAIEALQDCADGMYGASVAFSVRPEQQKWEGRDRRRIENAWLEHIALTHSRAYDGARVLSVRSAPASLTPNLDQILAERGDLAYSADVQRVATP
jgi:HK97 family phage prohead protease